MKKRKITRVRNISIFLSFIVIIMSFMPLFTIDKKPYTVFTLVQGVDVSSVNSLFGIIMPLWLVILILSIVPCMFTIYVILLLKGKSVDGTVGITCFISLLAIVPTAAALVMLGIKGEMSITPILYIRMILITVVYFYVVASIAFFDYKEKVEMEEKQAEQEVVTATPTPRQMYQKNFQIEEKHNFDMVYKVIFKNFMYNWKNFALLFASAGVSVMLIFSTLAIKGIMEGFHTQDRAYMGEGLVGILINALLLIGLITIILMGVSLEYYVKSRIKDYGIFIALGIKRKMLRLFIATEYIASLVISLIAGVIGGNIITLMFSKIISRNFHNQLPLPGLGVYGATFIICILIFLLSGVINFEIFIEKDLSNLMLGDMKKDHLSKKLGTILGSVGAVLVGFAVCLYEKRSSAESIMIIFLFLIGTYLMLTYWGGLLLKGWKKKSKTYYQRLFFMNDLHYQFKKNIKNMYLLFVVNFMILFYFSVQIVTLIPVEVGAQLLPYDFVCMGEDVDYSYFQSLEKKYDAEIETFEMVRVTVPGGSKAYGSGMEEGIVFQGQHIGISQTTYEALTGKKLDLEDKQVHLVFQEDKSNKAHPLDWDGMRINPKIHSGGPYPYIWYERYEIFANDYKITGQERLLLTGALLNGIQEDIIVFSDMHYKELKKWAGNPPEGTVAYKKYEQNQGLPKGATDVFLIDVPTSHKEEMKEELKQYEQKHQVYSEFDANIKAVYDKAVIFQNIKTERLLQFIINIFIYIILVLSGLYILFIKMAFKVSYLRKKYQFLEYMGMIKKNRRKNLCKELYINAFVPLLLAIIPSIIFIGSTWKIRLFTQTEVLEGIKSMGEMGLLYVGIQIVGVIFIRGYLIRKVEGEREE